MVQRVDFSVQSNLGNVADPSLAQDAATKNYVDTASGGFIVDQPGVFTNASVASGNIVLSNALAAGSTSTLVVQTTGAAGTETAIQTFITGRGTSQLWAFAGFNAEAFTISANGSSVPGRVTLSLGAAVTFPAIGAGTVLQFATTNPTFTPVKDLAPGAGVTAVVGTNSQGRATVTLSASGSSVSVNNAVVTNPNFQNNSAPLGTNLTVSGSNITAAVRNSDVVAVADSEIALKIGSVEPILTFPDIAIPLIISFPQPNQMILDVDSQQEAQLLLNKYLWRNANGTNNGTTDTLFVTAVQQQGATQFQSRITVTGNFSASGWTTATPTIYYTTNAPAGKFTFQPPPQAEIIRLAQGAVGTAASALNLGTIYNADNVGISVRVIASTPTVSNVSGVLNSVVDYGAITITSTPWPIPIPTGGNTAFLAIEASDFSWSGIGAIQTTPSNGLVQVAWIRKPAAALAGTSFTNARVWALVDAISTVFVGTSVADATNSRPPATTLTFPNLVANSITSAADSYGGSSTSVAVVPTIDNEIATLVGSTEPILTFTDAAIPLIVSFPSATQMILDVDSQAQAQTLLNKYLWRNANGTNNGTTDTLFVTAVQQEGVTQFQARITVTGSFTASNWTTALQAFYYTTNAPAGKYTFVPAPQAEIIRLAQANDVSSLNALRGDVNLVAGTGIAISATSPNITITNTGGGSGVSAGNSTTFRVNQRFPGVFNLRGFANTAAGFAYFALPIESSPATNVTTSGGFIGNTAFVSSTNDDNPTYGNGILFPTSSASVTDVVVIAKFPAFTCQLTVTGSSPSSATFSVSEAFFAKRNLSLATDDPTAQANQAPGFMAAVGNPNESQPLGIDIAPIISATYAGNGIWNLSLTASQFSGSVGNFALTGSSTQAYQVYLELEEDTITQNISAVSNIVVTGRGSMSVFFEIPGSGGSTPALSQVLGVSNLTGNNAIVYQDAQATPRSVSLQAPAAVSTSYQLRLPTAAATANGQFLASDTGGNLSWAAGTGTPGGTNFSYQYNNNGVFAGDNAMYRDVMNNRVSVFAPIEPANVARLLDVQLATAGIRPVDPQGTAVHIAEVNVVGTYTNNSGVGSATLTGTSILTVAGVIPNIGDIVLLQNQTAGLQNGSYTVNSATYTLNVVFATPACFPLVNTTVQFNFSNVSGGSASFTMNFNANQTLASAAATRPANLDSSWRYSFTGGNTAVLTSNLTSVRWTTTPTLDVQVVPGVTWQSGIPTGRTLNALTPFLITRTNIVPQYGNLWVATALNATNRGVQYFNSTSGTITVGTTPIVYTIFGLPNGATPNLDAVTSAGALSTRPITLQPPGGVALTLGASSAGSQPSITANSNFILNSSGAGNAVLITSNNSDFLALRGFSSSNNQHVIDAGVRELRLTSSSTTGVVINSTSATIALRPFLSGSASYNIVDSGSTELRINSTNAAGVTIGNLASLGTVNQSALQIRSTTIGVRLLALSGSAASNTNISIEALNAGQVNLGSSGQFVTIGQGNTFTTPLLVANTTSSPTALTSGTAGQVLTSRGPTGTPAWTNVSATFPFASWRLANIITVNNGTDTSITYDTVWQTSGGAIGLTLNAGVFTASAAATYFVTAQTAWASNSSGSRVTYFQATGTPNRIAATDIAANNDFSVYNTTGYWTAAAGDTLVVRCWQNSGSNLQTGGAFAAIPSGYSNWVSFQRIG